MKISNTFQVFKVVKSIIDKIEKVLNNNHFNLINIFSYSSGKVILRNKNLYRFFKGF